MDWLNSVKRSDLLTLDQPEKTLYLIPDYEDPEQAEQLLKEGYEGIFNRELSAWYTDKKLWPNDRGFEVFRAWFDVEYFDMVVDIVAGPIVNTLYDETTRSRRLGLGLVFTVRLRGPCSRTSLASAGAPKKSLLLAGWI